MTDDEDRFVLDVWIQMGANWTKDKDYYISCFGHFYAIEIMAMEDYLDGR